MSLKNSPIPSSAHRTTIQFFENEHQSWTKTYGAFFGTWAFFAPRRKGAFQTWIMQSCTHVVGEVRQFQDEFTTLFCHVVPPQFCDKYKVQLLISSLAWFETFNLKPTYIEKLSENPSWFWGHKNKWKGLSMRLCLSDFSSSNDLFSNDSIILCTAHNGWPPPWRFGILEKGPTSANFLVITCKKKWVISPYPTVSYCWLRLKHSSWPNGNQQLFWINWRRLTIPVVVNIRRSQIEISHDRS